MPRRLKRYLPHLLSVIALVAGSTLTVWAYGQVLQRENQRPRFFQIRSGTQHFDIYDGAQCLGPISIVLGPADDADLKLSVNGQLPFKYQGRNYQGNLEGDMFFNALGQLGGTIIRFKSPLVELSLMTADINPIRVVMVARGQGQRQAQQMTLPGPLLIEPDEPGFYRLRHDQLNSLQAMGQGLLSSNLLQLRIVPQGQGGPCLAQQPLDISAKLETLRRQLEPLQQLFRLKQP